MVIVLVIDTFDRNNNGTTISAMRFAETLSQRGHTIRIITCGDPVKSGLDQDTGYGMYYVPEFIIPLATYFAHKQNTLFAKPVYSTLRKAIIGADVVHIYEPWPLGKAAQKIAKRVGVPTVAAFHIQPENITYNIGLSRVTPIAHLIYYLFHIFFYRKFKHIHCPSRFIATQLRSHGYKAWLHIISNGVHPVFRPGPKRERKDTMFRILMVGRLSPEKRQDVLIRAVLQSKYADRIQLYFAGYGPWEKKLRRMGEKLPNPPVFGYYGTEELVELMRNCDLYVHASDVEIEGISCMEAFSCGLVPVISDSKRSATGQFALSKENLFKAGSPFSLAQSVDYWLDDEDRRNECRECYLKFSQEFTLKRSVIHMEHVYESLAVRKKNGYYHNRIYKILTNVFYKGIAVPLLFLWTRIMLGVRIKGIWNVRSLKGAVTLCNHVHVLDSVLVALALFPHKVVFPTLPLNVKTLWPGILVRLLGGVSVPENVTDMKVFLDEMEMLLCKERVVHFFPEGELIPYDTKLRDFKKGAFYLAARARVPLIPMSISFRKPRGLRRLIRRKPTMVLHIGKPIQPVDMDFNKDSLIRMRMAKEQMNRFLSQQVS